MATQINIQSFNQILGNMIRTIIAETPLNDINAGSILLTLLEAAAANDFENNTAILNVLELLNIDATQNNDLDARAGDYGLTRFAAIKASGQVTLFNTSITKRAVGLYSIKPAPIAGQDTLFVVNSVGWEPSGSLYIGRGTQNFEGPIAYSSITVFPTFSQINLSSALQNNHLSSDIVIDSQGQPDRVIAAGTVVDIPANNQNPQIQYMTLRDAILPSGEDTLTGVQVIALVAGSQGNAGINTISTFDTSPFSGAAVSNSNAFTNGADTETDVELRNRIKSYSVTLARGTVAAIEGAVIGTYNPDDNKQVVSAVITEPTEVGDPSILYIDDGTGFEPSYAGQSVDTMLTNATGTEDFLQLANFPLPRPQVVNTEAGPFNVTDGSFLRVTVDGAEEVIDFTSANFLNISAATVSEIITVINNTAKLFSARFTNNGSNILLYPVAFDAEIIQVTPQLATDANALYINNLLKFPTNEFSYISLFKNATRLHEKAKLATVETSSFGSWNIVSSGDIIISVDGTPAQDRTFTLGDFPGASSFTSLSLAQWVTAFNAKFAGLTAVATANQTMLITSNQTDGDSSIDVIGGTYIGEWFTNGVVTSTGQASEFQLNRQTGNLRVFNINPGDNVSAGLADAKGFVISSATTSGTYNISSDSVGRPSNMVVVADSTFCNQDSLDLLVGATISITNPGADGYTMRIMSSTLAAFQTVLPGDFIYITPRTSGWVSSVNSGLFKIFDKGNHVTAGVDSFIDVHNAQVSAESNVSILDTLDIQAFSTDGFPQIWNGAHVLNPATAAITDIVNSLNTDLINVKASVYESNSIKITSTTEAGGSIAIPVSVSNALLLFTETTVAQLGNPPLIANRVPGKDLVSYFSRENLANAWLGRHTFVDVKRSLLANSIPDVPPYTGTYSEIVDANLSVATANFEQYLSFTRGDNRGQFRNIKAFPSSGNVGTQEGTARTQLDHIIGDELQVISPIQLSADDSIVIVMDNNPTIETVNIPMARTGRVNSGDPGGGGTFLPTTTEFSADDIDGGAGVDFSSSVVWGTATHGTDFSDYAVWFRARNWYFAGGVGSGQGELIVRAQQYGLNGDSLRFALGYPSLANQSPTTTFVNTPSFSTYTYSFGSGPARATALPSSDTITVTGPYPNTSTNFPAGSPSTGNYYDYTFASGTFTSVVVGDVISIVPGSGVSQSNSGQFSVVAVNGNTIRVLNPDASVTTPGTPGTPETTTLTTKADVVGTATSYQVALAASDPNLATAATYGVLAGSTITNTGSTVVTGDLGLYPGTSVTGFPPGTVSGTEHVTDSAAHQAQTDALAAYTTFAAHSSTTIPSALDGQTLTAGYYSFSSGAATLAASGPGTLTLSGSATDVFVIKTASTLTTGAGGIPTITLTGGALASNVYWIVGSSATINSGSAGTFVGTIIAQTSITDTLGGTVNGRLIALTGAVTLSAAANITVPGSISGGSLNLKYFTIYDTQGSVGVWYDVNNTGEPPPIFSPAVNRTIKVATVVTGDSAATIATKTGQAIALDNAFTVGVIGSEINITNTANGITSSGTSNTSGFTVGTTTGSAAQTLNGTYFIVYDQAGSVAVWFNLGGSLTTPPLSGADRSIAVTNANFGDSANNIATATIMALNADPSFTATTAGDVVTIKSTTDGHLPAGNAGTTGFTPFTDTPGTLSDAEVISNPAAVTLFPLVGNDVATIVATVNAGTILELTAVGSPTATITMATAQDNYTYGGNATALAFGHNPTDPTANSFISLFDGVGVCKAFENPNPNFTLKAPLLLNGVSSAYSLDTAPNSDTDDVGEYFKLIPTSIKNIYHQFTQPAISQLPIVANVSISNDRKRVQIDSLMLGSAGAIEVVGGQANMAQAYITSESEDVSDVNGNYLLVKIPAFPDTFNTGDFVTIQNDAGVQRLSRLESSDTMNVTVPSAGTAEYNFNPKAINVTSGTTFTITDVSSTYGRPAGYVWRWTAPGLTLSVVNAGDIVFAFGSTIPWAQGNQVQVSGDENIAGFPIIAVNSGSNYFDVVNPIGTAMSATAVGSGNTVQICPTPAIRWTLSHAANISAASIVSNGTTVTVITGSAARLNTGDSVGFVDSLNLADGTYGPVTVLNPTTFTFVHSSSAFTETASGASIIKSGLIPTRYRVEKLGFNGLVRLSRQDGVSPNFLNCGVAVDDYIILGGTTFKSNNNGRFRVAALDNDSIVFVNSQASDELNTIIAFNNNSLQATWTAGANFVTGLAGTFKNVSVGDWVKQPQDPDSFYLQVISMNSTSALSTQITLGGSYEGVTGIAPGVSYDELNNYDKGIYLQNVDDITIFEGDAVVPGDTLTVQNIIDPNWFSVNNIGTFEVVEFGTNGTTFKPYIRVDNSSAAVQSGVAISVAPAGFFVTESLINKFYSVRQVSYSVLDDLSTTNRSVYLKPDDRSYKFTNANNTSITHNGKFGYSTDVTTGIDGYLYYTGLLQQVQRIVDGFEPNSTTYPGQRAVGAAIETLPPLVLRITLNINVTTNVGVNLGDISNNIKSVIINYVQGLGVGQDVILSEIIAQVMNIVGVAAVTFTTPIPSTERITVPFNTRADVEAADIGIA